jgi:hypothetical protein
VLKLLGAEAAGLTRAEGDQILAVIENDLEVLRQVNRRVDRLERCGFSKRYESEIPNVIAKMEDVTFEKVEGPRFSIIARIHSWIEDFSQDEIDAFVLSYRVFTQRNDRLSIASRAKIYEKDWMSENARVCFEDARRQLNGHLDRMRRSNFPEAESWCARLSTSSSMAGRRIAINKWPRYLSLWKIRASWDLFGPTSWFTRAKRSIRSNTSADSIKG